MFNRSFNLSDFIGNIPSLAIKKQLLLSLVGSVNASIYATADAIVAKLETEGYDALKELSNREIIALCSGPETGASVDVIAAAKKMYKLHLEWRAMLQHTTVVATGKKPKVLGEKGSPDEGKDISLGSMWETIKMMSGPQRVREIDTKAIALVQAVGIEVSTQMLDNVKAKKLARDNHFAVVRKNRRDDVQVIIDRLIAHAVDEDDDEAYSQLDAEVKEYLANKCMVALNKATSIAVENTLLGNTRADSLGMGDYIILQKLIPQFIEAMSVAHKVKAAKPEADKAITDKAKRVRKAAKPVVQRAPKPTQANSVTSVEANGFKVTRSVETV